MEAFRGDLLLAWLLAAAEVARLGGSLPETVSGRLSLFPSFFLLFLTWESGELIFHTTVLDYFDGDFYFFFYLFLRCCIGSD
ncbi:hypothetical protein J3E69DRAFT_323880 [Trichoderma sp. SZMC 28015]